MKSQLIRVACLTALLVTGAWAQSLYPVTVKVPFDFNAGRATVPAGEYVLKADIPGTLRIMTPTGRQVAMIVTMQRLAYRVPQKSKLVFRTYGDRRFLGEVWVAGQSYASAIGRTAAEREATLRAGKSAETVIYASNR